MALGLLGALVLAFIGARTLWAAFRVRLGGELPEEVGSPRRAFATSVAATASYPLTRNAHRFHGAHPARRVRARALRPRMLATVDVVAGSGLLGFAGLLGWRAVHES